MLRVRLRNVLVYSFIIIQNIHNAPSTSIKNLTADTRMTLDMCISINLICLDYSLEAFMPGNKCKHTQKNLLDQATDDRLWMSSSCVSLVSCLQALAI